MVTLRVWQQVQSHVMAAHSLHSCSRRKVKVGGETVGQGCALEARIRIGMHCAEEEIGPVQHQASRTPAQER